MSILKGIGSSQAVLSLLALLHLACAFCLFFVTLRYVSQQLVEDWMEYRANPNLLTG
jgi:hypothetical protein